MGAPPVRLSLDDVGLDLEVVSWIEVLLDGVPQDDVVAFDARDGFIVRPCRDALGRPIVSALTGEYQVQTVRGDVTARWRAGTPPLSTAL